MRNLDFYRKRKKKEKKFGKKNFGKKGVTITGLKLLEEAHCFKSMYICGGPRWG